LLLLLLHSAFSRVTCIARCKYFAKFVLFLFNFEQAASTIFLLLCNFVVQLLRFFFGFGFWVVFFACGWWWWCWEELASSSGSAGPHVSRVAGLRPRSALESDGGRGRGGNSTSGVFFRQLAEARRLREAERRRSGEDEEEKKRRFLIRKRTSIFDPWSWTVLHWCLAMALLSLALIAIVGIFHNFATAPPVFAVDEGKEVCDSA
jgi:hypothetical protein